MCLLITQNESSERLGKSWLADFYSYNGDGLGVMYAEKGKLKVIKALPKTTGEVVHFYRDHIQGRVCAWHLRMRTHGATDYDNCHPYEVLNKREHGLDLWLMHNGVLSTGNASDTTRSDTWHYIRDYLRPILAANPDLAFLPEFQEIIAKHIGASNKFVLADNLGRMATINRASGVEWRGHWMSNTYAWTAPDQYRPKPLYYATKPRKAEPVPNYDAWADTSWGADMY